MDYLALKRQYVFLNERNAMVRVHTTKVADKNFDIWVEGKSKKYREAVKVVQSGLKQLEDEELPPIVIVSSKKLGENSFASYDNARDIIYFNNKYGDEKKLEDKLMNSNFKAKNIVGVLQHELGHKKHWDAIKRYYKANKTRYNSIKEAKNSLDAKLEKYIVNQPLFYLSTNVSVYADISFFAEKRKSTSNDVNEVIAEVLVDPSSIKDTHLVETIQEELNYGKIRTNGYR